MAAKSLSELRKSRGNFENLSKRIDEAKSKTEREDDDRIWQCKTDEAGNGSAVIRFLPAPKGESDAWVKMFTHGFKGPNGKWYIENSRTTLNPPGKWDEKDPVMELNNRLWDTKDPKNIEIAKKQKRKLNYYSNVLIISDPANPENEGKVKLFRYGAKIFEKLQSAMKPEFDDETPFNPFDFWEGANFRLKIVRKDDYANFDKCSLADPKPLSDDDDELDRIWSQCHSLQDLISPDKFKSYEELEKRLNLVLGSGGPAKSAEKTELSEEDEEFIRSSSKRSAKKTEVVEDDDPPFETERKPAKAAEKPSTKKVEQSTADEDDDLEYFRKLASGD